MHAGSAGATDVSRVILVGGNANMAGLAEYLEAALEVEVVIGNVWTNVFSFQEHIPTMHHRESLEFATSIGLALRSLMRTG
jgi:Tfp pilus assembly PilM family ATPase